MKERTEDDYWYKQARDRVERYLDDIAKGNVIADIWCIEDVEGRAEEQEIELTEDECRDVLSYMQQKSDANFGMNWDVMDCWIDRVVSERT